MICNVVNELQMIFRLIKLTPEQGVQNEKNYFCNLKLKSKFFFNINVLKVFANINRNMQLNKIL